MLQRFGFIDQAALGENITLALVQAGHGGHQQAMALVAFLAVSQQFIRQRAIIGQPILPFAFAFFAQRAVQAGIAAKAHAPIHRNDLVLGHAQRGSDGFQIGRLQIAIFNGADLAFQAAQIEKQFFLGRRRADLHQRP